MFLSPLNHVDTHSHTHSHTQTHTQTLSVKERAAEVWLTHRKRVSSPRNHLHNTERTWETSQSSEMNETPSAPLHNHTHIGLKRRAKQVPELYICACVQQQHLKRAWSRRIIHRLTDRGGKGRLNEGKNTTRERETEQLNMQLRWERERKRGKPEGSRGMEGRRGKHNTAWEKAHNELIWAERESARERERNGHNLIEESVRWWKSDAGNYKVGGIHSD